MLPYHNRIVTIQRSKYLPSRNRGIPIPKEPETIGGHLRRQRLQSKLFQAQVARKLGVSTVTLSKWERDLIYPSWDFQSEISGFLGYDPFTNKALGGIKSNESSDIASLLPKNIAGILQRIEKIRILSHKSRRQIAIEMNTNAKTIWGWKTGKRSPSRMLLERIEKYLKQTTLP